jgi:HAD superfamily hydrolase (TIGR01509 family)
MYGKSSEMFERVFGTAKFSKEEIDAISERKERRYREEFLPELKLLNGLQKFLDNAKSKGIALAIGTAAPKLNVDFVIDNLNLGSYFPVIVEAADVRESKPHPEVFLKAASRLGVLPEQCVVFEDAPKGIEAAARAGMKAVAVTSYHNVEELENENVLFMIDDFASVELRKLF